MEKCGTHVETFLEIKKTAPKNSLFEQSNLYHTEGEIRTKEEVENGCTVYLDGVEWIEVAKFETLEEAREKLKSYNSTSEKMNWTVPFYKVTEYFISKNNDDLEIWDFAEWK